MEFFDTHAHLLSEQFDGDREEVIRSIQQQGVTRMLEAGTNLSDSANCIALAKAHDFIYAAIGIHPHEAEGAPQDYLGLLEKMAREEKCVAIGESGLDYHYDFSPREIQREVFCAQIDLACELDLPVIIHDREAHQDVMDVIQQRKGKLRRMLMHCYSGSAEMAQEYCRMGYYLSFGGAITFKNARKAEEVLRAIPKERILAETDCPYLAPVPMRGKRNDPSLIRYTIARMAEILEMAPEETARLTMENGRRFFGI